MKKLLAVLAAGLFSLSAIGQSYPSPTFNSVTLQNPLAAAYGGTGVANSSSITLGGSLTTAGANPLTFVTTGSTNITLPTSGTLLTSTGAASVYAPLASPGFTGAPTSPTPAQFDNSTKLVTSAFVKAAGLQYPISGGLAISTATTLMLAQLNAWGVFSVNVTATLPLVSTTEVGATFTIQGGASGGTIKGNSSDVIVDAQGISANTLYVAPGAVYTVTSNGGNWYVTSSGKSRTTGACPAIIDYGGNPNGSTDNTAALSATIAASPSGVACVYFGPGNWAFSSAYSYSFPAALGSLTIAGAGQDATNLLFNGTSGLNISFVGASDAVHIRDLSVLQSTACSACTGIGIGQTVPVSDPAIAALSTFNNVTVRGADAYAATDYWGTGIELSKVSNFNITNLQVAGSNTQQGVGVQVDSGPSNPPVQFNFQGGNFVNLAEGIILNTLVQGVTINQTNFTGVIYGVFTPTGTTGMDQLTISNSQFNCTIGVYLNSGWQNVTIANNLFIVGNTTGWTGIFDNAAVLFVITGNTFQNANAPSLSNNPKGIYINNTAGVAGIISNNLFRYMSPAITLDTAASGVNVQSNAYFNNNVNITNSGTGNTIGGGSQ